MRVAVIGCGNIGYSIITSSLSRGDSVYAFDIIKPDYLDSCSGDISFITLDAASSDSVSMAISKAELPKHSIDALIGTVGTTSDATPLSDPDEYERVFNINFYGNLIPIQQFTRNELLSDKARIIILGSTSGHFAGNSLSAYSPSKWALASMCGSLRSELSGAGITVDVVNPRTIKNVHSETFTSSGGIDVNTVSEKVMSLLDKPVNGDSFVPSYYGAFHYIERCAAGLFNIAFHLKPRFIRKRVYKNQGIASALITGASSGLGLNLAKMLGTACSTLYLAARNKDALDGLKCEIEKNGKCKVIPIVVDLYDKEAPIIIAGMIGAENVDILINNAGHQTRGNVLDMTIEEYKREIRLNFFSHAELTMRLLAQNNKPKQIVNILSTTAIAGRKELSAYAAPKAAMWSFTKALRRTYGNSVCITDVIPSTFASGLSARSSSLEKTPEAQTDTPSAASNGSRLSSIKLGLNSSSVAEIIVTGIRNKKDSIYIPHWKTSMFIAFEALAPKRFRRMFR